MEIKKLDKNIGDTVEDTFEDIVEDLYNSEDNFNNCDVTSGQRVRNREEIRELLIREIKQVNKEMV